MSHEEIRFRILYSLYKKYYQGQIKCWQHIDDVIDDAMLKKADRNLVLGDTTYLADKYLVQVKRAGNRKEGALEEDNEARYPEEIRITAGGIDEIESIIDGEVQKEIDEIKSKMVRSSRFGLGHIARGDQIRSLIQPEIELAIKATIGKAGRRKKTKA